MSLKGDDSVRQEKHLYSLSQREWQKKDKNILLTVEKEKQKLTLIVIS